MTVLPVCEDMGKTKKGNLEADQHIKELDEDSKVKKLEEELQKVKEREQKKMEKLEEELNRIKESEKRKVEKLESEMEKMRENLEMFRVLATRRMEELERLVHEDMGDMEEEMWKNMDATRKANIDLAALLADGKQATDERLQRLDETQRKNSQVERDLHSSVARCEFELNNLTAKVHTLEEGWYLETCGGERKEYEGDQKNNPGGETSSHPLGGEVHQLKDAIISVLKGVDTSYTPRNGVSNGVSNRDVWLDSNSIKLTINMKMTPKDEI